MGGGGVLLAGQWDVILCLSDQGARRSGRIKHTWQCRRHAGSVGERL